MRLNISVGVGERKCSVVRSAIVSRAFNCLLPTTVMDIFGFEVLILPPSSLFASAQQVAQVIGKVGALVHQRNPGGRRINYSVQQLTSTSPPLVRCTGSSRTKFALLTSLAKPMARTVTRFTTRR